MTKCLEDCYHYSLKKRFQLFLKLLTECESLFSILMVRLAGASIVLKFSERKMANFRLTGQVMV
ncbi:MAG TPA: hypothetical protein DCR17_07460 [Verrucomicrobiales bacterium]|nr:hypothetical protein [Verrucomicrobiales bacterium]HAQ98102.1 hypothetical protein [Verrucomicrobiales bacterium]